MKDRRNLVHEHQPFGDAHDYNVHGTHGRPGMHHNLPGATSVRLNCGVDHPESKEDQAPGAEAMASKHGDKPFYWTGTPKRGV